ncbi:MAG: hypothetical protein ACOC8B_00780 [Gemmatimonadota bacterium]
MPTSRLWIHGRDPFESSWLSVTGSRIRPDGAVREVRLPVRFDALSFTPERIWGVQRDRLDVASIAWIGLPGDR